MKCDLCERSVKKTFRHHLIPRSTWGKKRIQRDFSSEDKHKIVNLCESCTSNIHTTISEKEMALKYNSVELLKSHPLVAKFIHWIKAKPSEFNIKSKK